MVGSLLFYIAIIYIPVFSYTYSIKVLYKAPYLRRSLLLFEREIERNNTKQDDV